jgi:hypothetical protein
MGEPVQAQGDCARRGGRRHLAGPRSGRAIGVDDRGCASLGCGREIAERVFDVGEDSGEAWELLGVASLHADRMRDLGEAAGQAVKRASLSGRARRTTSVALNSEGSGARRGRGSGGHDGDGRWPATRPQWALNPIRVPVGAHMHAGMYGPAWAGRRVQRRSVGPPSLVGPRPVRACDREPAAPWRSPWTGNVSGVEGRCATVGSSPAVRAVAARALSQSRATAWAAVGRSPCRGAAGRRP